MSLEEIAVALSGYHEGLMLLSSTISSNAPKDVGYEFKTVQGKLLPKLDTLADELRKHASKGSR